jgi:hypothetical protein
MGMPYITSIERAGLEQGRAEGQKALRDAAREILESRFQEVPVGTQEELVEVSDLGQLRMLVRQATHRFQSVPEPAEIAVKLYHQPVDDLRERVLIATAKLPVVQGMRQVSTPGEDLPPPPVDDFDLKAELEKNK